MKKKKSALSQRQRLLLVYIHEYKELYPYSPDVREMGRGINVSSTSVVNYYLNELEQRGFVSFLYLEHIGKRHNYRAARTVHLTEKGKRFIKGLLKIHEIARSEREIVSIPI